MHRFASVSRRHVTRAVGRFMRLWPGLLLCGLSIAAFATTVRVHYDVGWGNRITIRGDHAPLSWAAGTSATWTSGNVWVVSWPDSAGDMDWKPLVNDSRWSTGGNYHVRAGQTLDVYPFFGPAKGRVVIQGGVYSPQLNNSRSLRIYLPPSYDENLQKRYPVLYMHDAQNLFDAATAFAGVEWRVDETIDGLVGSGAMDEVIVVGIDNTPGRIDEYTPCCDPTYGGGKIDSYTAFILQTVKPFVDRTYRTRAGRNDTAMLGSSLGGLASFDIGWHHPEVFGKAGSMSGSFWWNGRSEVATVGNAEAKPAVRFYVDAGTVNDGLADTRALHAALLGVGYVQGQDLDYFEAVGGSHDEASWAARLYLPLTRFFPWGSTAY
jgi:predicted alpha/beta superfamily hydrolase